MNDSDKKIWYKYDIKTEQVRLMQKQIRQSIVQHLWQDYLASTPQMQIIVDGLQKKSQSPLILDHFAIIDLPSAHTGIRQLSELFSALGFVKQGEGYLPEKQNDFVWMVEHDAHEKLATDTLPQVVVADFRLTEMPLEIRQIIEKYTNQSITSMPTSNLTAITQYLAGRDWPLPTVKEFRTVQAFNELLAWVLVMGRKPNHFTVSVHLLDSFADIHAFRSFVENDMQLPLNHEGGTIKGNAAAGIAQGSTTGILQPILLADGEIQLPTGFVEFIWRFPKDSKNQTPTFWHDYFTGFVPQYANHVIESLYVND